jgi:hypothetical protein
MRNEIIFYLFFYHHHVALVLPYNSGTTSHMILAQQIHMIEVPLRSKGTFEVALWTGSSVWLFLCCLKKVEIVAVQTCCNHVTLFGEGEEQEKI